MEVMGIMDTLRMDLTWSDVHVAVLDPPDVVLCHDAELDPIRLGDREPSKAAPYDALGWLGEPLSLPGNSVSVTIKRLRST